MIQSTTNQTLLQLKNVLSQLKDEQFVKPLEVLNNTTIGAHVRHILEFYKCLMASGKNGILNYDSRNRDKNLELSVENCMTLLDEIVSYVINRKEDYPLRLSGNYCEEPGGQNFCIESTFFRELLYNIEHAVHHMAIIKIGINELDDQIILEDGFGVAASTLRFKKLCAQ